MGETSLWHPRSSYLQRQPSSNHCYNGPMNPTEFRSKRESHGGPTTHDAKPPPPWQPLEPRSRARGQPMAISAPRPDRPQSAAYRHPSLPSEPKRPQSASGTRRMHNDGAESVRSRSTSTASYLPVHATEYRGNLQPAMTHGGGDRRQHKENERSERQQQEAEIREKRAMPRPSSTPCGRSGRGMREAEERPATTKHQRRSREVDGPVSSFPQAGEANDVDKAEAYRTGLKGIAMRRARIPDRNEFPYSPTKGWYAAKKNEKGFFSFNPIRHTVDKFAVKDGRLQQERTQYTIPVPHLNSQKHNRLKGVVEFSDITRLTGERWNPGYHERYQKNNRAFYNKTGTIVAFADTMLRQGYKP